MTTVQELIALQGVRDNNFDKFVSTIRKAPLDRRTEEFYIGKRNELVVLWQTFEKAENQIRNDPSLPQDAPYIAENLHKTVGEKFSSTMDYIEAELDKLKSVKSKPGQMTKPKSQETGSEGQAAVQWRQFYELFLETVDKQPLPNVQKMWYLKTNLSGEADKLISHLALTEDNYKTAWMLLQERYNNKRILVSTLVERILNQSTGTSSTASIKALHDTTRECMLALNNLDIDTSSDALLIQLITKKLDHTLYIRFMQSLTKPKEVSTMKELFAFLEMQFESMESIGKVATTQKGSSKTVSSIASVEDNKCNLCKTGHHPIYRCKQFLAMGESERLKWVQQRKMCTNCFKYDHVAKSCTSSNCKICSTKHNTLLHLPNKSKTSSIASNQTPVTRNDSTPVNTAAISSASVEDQKNVILATAKVIVKAANGMPGEFRAVLDSGSQVNIVTERLIKKLSLKTRDASLSIDGFGKIQRRAYHRVNVQLLSNNSEFSTDLEAFVLPTIIPAQPNHDLDISNWQIPKNIKLADPNFNTQGKIDILLGAEFYFSLTQPGTIKLNGNQPILQNTALGWIVGGLIEQTSTDVTPTALTCAIFDSETSLEQAIEKLWKLEEVESSEKVMSPL
ncbi:uncharacterized protein [Musca autumnalis]|uniref:uncharacterized protein n=1 Tax=Musca autumnalis TaxID=221902 RepID=UPI003CE9AEFB